MPFRILGINHKTAPVAIRERVAFTADRLGEALRALCEEPGVAEAVILSTCNRTEVYWTGAASGADVSQWLQGQDRDTDLSASLYLHESQHAVEHAFSVAAGLDSMMLGEAQILGQLKDAYRLAQAAGSTGPVLNKLFQASFSAAKRVRTETRIGANAVSIASAAVSLAQRVFADLAAQSALFIGAGEMIALTARHVASHGVKRIVIANRSLARAQALAIELNAVAAGLDDMVSHLIEADIVISSTASPTPIITKAAAAAAARARRHRPIFMVDLAVPRDIEPDVADLPDVYLFSIDDLQKVVAHNLHQREAEAVSARLMIGQEVERFLADFRSHDAGAAIRVLRAQADHVRSQTLDEARRMLASGRQIDEVLSYLANTLTGRLMHQPIHALREAAQSEDPRLMQTLARLILKDPGV
jgi:glutamyl-tRNA reductase